MNISGEMPFAPSNYFSESDDLQNKNNAQNELSCISDKNECFTLYWSYLRELFKIFRSCKS